jgi:hypothetical protein
MKTAISIPDPLNEDIEAYLTAAKMSRSAFFQRAAKLYLREVSAKAVTANLDAVYGVEEPPGDASFRRAALSHLRNVMGREKW